MIDAAQLDHLANLARLQLTAEEKTNMQRDLSRMLGYFEQLSEVNTEGVEEMQRPIHLVNVLRDDLPSSPFSREVVEALAPEMQGGQIKIPRTVEAE